MTAGDGWGAYYAAEAGRPPRPLLLEALGLFTGAGRAADLGCGDGADSLELLRRGWHVIAVDREPAAVARLQSAVAAHACSRLVTVVGDMADVALPELDLVYFGWSLPHCSAAVFPQLWRRIRTALRPGGVVAAQVLGPADDWARLPDTLALARTDLDDLLSGLEVLELREVSEDRRSYDGPKHWHYYEVIARRCLA